MFPDASVSTKKNGCFKVRKKRRDVNNPVIEEHKKEEGKKRNLTPEGMSLKQTLTLMLPTLKHFSCWFQVHLEL